MLEHARATGTPELRKSCIYQSIPVQYLTIIKHVPVDKLMSGRWLNSPARIATNLWKWSLPRWIEN